MPNRTQLNILSSGQEAAIRAAQSGLLVAELAVISWPTPDQEEVHAWQQWDQDSAFGANFTTWLNSRPLICSFVADDGVSRFHDLPLSSGIGDDTVTLKFTNNPAEIERKLYDYNKGVRIEFFYYIAGLDIVISRWIGTLRAAEDSDLDYVQVTADSGFTSPDVIIPNWIHASDCQAYFAPLLALEQRAGHPCDYDLDIGGSRGLNDPATGLPFTDCEYTRDACLARMGDLLSYAGDDTVREATQIGSGSHTTTSVVEGQETRLKNPVPVVMGKFRVKNCLPLATADEVNPKTKNKDFGTKRTLIEISAGPVKSISDPLIMGNLPQGQDIRRGTQQQTPTVFSPNVLNYNRRAVANLNINPVNPKTIQVSQINAEFTVEGQELVRVYSDPNTFVETYTRLRAWLLLMTLLNDWWGYALDAARLDIDDFLLLAGTGRQFNGVLTGATVQTVIADFLVPVGWLTFFYDGKQRFLPMEALDLNDAGIPVFTDGTRQAGLTDTIPTQNILKTSPEDGEKPRIKIRYKAGKNLYNEVTVVWYDEANDWVERPSRFSDKKAQIAAGKIWGDNSKNRLPVQYSAAGVTSLTEVISTGALYRDLGPNGDGGLLNNLEVTIVVYGMLPEALNMHPGKVFKLLTSRLTPFKDPAGNPFKFFRAKRITHTSRGELEILAQAYGEIFWNNNCPADSGYVIWDTPNDAVIDGPNGQNTQIQSTSSNAGATGQTWPDTYTSDTVSQDRWVHTVLQLPASDSYNVWDGNYGFKVWHTGEMWVYRNTGIETFPAGTVNAGDKLSVEYDFNNGAPVRRYKQNGILLYTDTGATPTNVILGITFATGILIGDVFWEVVGSDTTITDVTWECTTFFDVNGNDIIQSGGLDQHLVAWAQSAALINNANECFTWTMPNPGAEIFVGTATFNCPSCTPVSLPTPYCYFPTPFFSFYFGLDSDDKWYTSEGGDTGVSGNFTSSTQFAIRRNSGGKAEWLVDGVVVRTSTATMAANQRLIAVAGTRRTNPSFAWPAVSGAQFCVSTPCVGRDRIDPGVPGGGTEPQILADSQFVLIDRFWTDSDVAAGVPGIYVAAGPQTRTYTWPEFELYRDIGAGYQLLHETTAEAVIGIAATVLAGTEIGTETVDIDLLPAQSLASYTSGQVAAGAGRVYLGGEIFRYQTATQLSTTPNRWRLSVLSNRGEKCTEAFKATHATGEKFAVLDPASVIFLPLAASEIGQTRNFKGITAGQNLALYSPVSFTFNAPNFQPTTPADYNLSFDSGRSEVLHDWMPFADACIVTTGLVYEIYEDASGAPGALLWSGTASEWREPVSGTGVRTYHFRVKTDYAAGAYLIRSITITSGQDGGLFGEPLFGE